MINLIKEIKSELKIEYLFKLKIRNTILISHYIYP